MTALVPDPAWRAQIQDEGLVVHAGADLAYLLPDVPSAEARVLVELFEPVLRGSARPLDPEQLTAPVRAHLPQLRSLGALRPAGLPAPDKPLNVGVRVVGAEPAGLGRHFDRNSAQPDVVLIVRTTGTLRDLAELREPKPHLLLDLAYHHTASLGPFVVPGASACLGCLAVRARHRWGDPEPPARPAATTADFPFLWAKHAIDRLAAGSLALLDRVVTLHLDEFTTTAEDVLPAADCDVCPRFEVGRVELPWGKPDDNRLTPT
ncbi:hypothetical protein ALI22I_19015 [Saccharothrix sp. ALI-22-I]|uniref:hypothetical protein n=1 Tax=Saccharothrix sp. ALI-22-I TaxID=1933778 RepID=UPI00097C4137|nr:hypothetical protein [Saccharothrix sp. ALI-22-I]ONI88450.1 hypothetical protein ALI22I_19015 [Saccharothrix sp. ALI-22-I]